MQLSIATTFPQVQRQLKQMQEDLARKALARAMNRSVEQARVQMQREIAREFAVTVSYVRERLVVRKAYANGALGLTAQLIGGGKRRSANIIRFVEKSVSLAQARKRAKDGTQNVLRVKVKRGTYKPLPGAFIGNKGRTVFKRVGAKRLPIKPVQTVDVAQMFNTRRINSVVVATLQQRFPEIFAREAAYYLRRFANG